MLTEPHDDNGNAFMREFIPKGIAPCDKITWGKAINDAREQGLPTRIDALADKSNEIVKLLNQIIISINLAKKYRRDHEDIFNARINSLQKSLEQIQNNV